jgi:hypothetical protein
MKATVWPHRIDILEADSLPRETWEPLLNDLKAEPIPGFTPSGKRVALSAARAPRGGTDAFIYRSTNMSDDEVIRILGTYGIAATVGAGDASPTVKSSAPAGRLNEARKRR